MTLHVREWSNPPQRSELLPSAQSLASVLVMGLFALSLAAAGVGFRIWRRR